MVIGDQLKALVKSHIEGDDAQFLAVAMQVAAHEARAGHGKLAKEIRDLIDRAKSASKVILAEPVRMPSRMRSSTTEIASCSRI